MGAGDYSYARPGGAVLKAAGITAVGRYLATDDRGLTKTEYADLTANGIAVWLIYEGNAQGMLNGRAQGISDAQFAQSQITALGLPSDSPVYVAADFDCYTAAQMAACDAYLQGWETIIPLSRTGLYGGLYYLKHVHDAGLASGFWECASTSFRHGVTPDEMPVQIRQTLANPGVPNLDADTILATEYGAIGDPLEEDMPLTAADISAVATAVTQELATSEPFLAAISKTVGGADTTILRSAEFSQATLVSKIVAALTPAIAAKTGVDPQTLATDIENALKDVTVTSTTTLGTAGS